ncbi:MAG: hypothetical protein OXF28_03955 [Thaumarchaeota archaeon]|nr:hypothetical protein [Nitrososphaerota archaeon]MCY3976266.1 hypothetical protein [Nitrososphaerota archaeon]
MIGKIIHLAKSGRLIIQLTKLASEGQIIIDNNNVKIGKIREIIGSVSTPYASASPLIEITNNHIGKMIGTNKLDTNTN